MHATSSSSLPEEKDLFIPPTFHLVLRQSPILAHARADKINLCWSFILIFASLPPPPSGNTRINVRRGQGRLLAVRTHARSFRASKAKVDNDRSP